MSFFTISFFKEATPSIYEEKTAAKQLLLPNRTLECSIVCLGIISILSAIAYYFAIKNPHFPFKATAHPCAALISFGVVSIPFGLELFLINRKSTKTLLNIKDALKENQCFILYRVKKENNLKYSVYYTIYQKGSFTTKVAVIEKNTKKVIGQAFNRSSLGITCEQITLKTLKSQFRKLS